MAADETRAAAEVSALLARVRGADAAYRAWAGVALLGGDDARYHDQARTLVRPLCDAARRHDVDLDHGDIACFAMLSLVCLDATGRARIAAAVPRPNADAARRSRLFDSPLYVYLTVRGLASDLVDPEALARFVAEDASSTASHSGADVPALMLQLATTLELSGIKPPPDSLMRAINGRLVDSDGDSDAAGAVRWLLKRYDRNWPGGTAAADLKATAESYVRRFLPTSIEASTLRIEVVVMLLEAIALSDPSYVLTQSEIDRRVSVHLGTHRMVASMAYVLLLAIACGGLALWLRRGTEAPAWLAALAALCLWFPIAAWAVLVTLGRRRKEGALLGAIVLSLAYAGFVAFAALTRSKDLLAEAEKDALFATVPAVLLAVFGAWPSLKE